MKKRLWILFSLMLTFIMMIGSVEVKAAKKKKKVRWTEMIVEEVSDSLVERIDKELRAKKRVKLMVSGDENIANQKIKEIKEKIKKVNFYGVIFQYKKGKKGKFGVEYLMNQDDAKLYDITIRFLERLHKMVSKYYKSEEVGDYYHRKSVFKIKKKDYEKFMDGKELFLRIVYDTFVEWAAREYHVSSGYTERTTSDIYYSLSSYIMEGEEEQFIKSIDSYIIKERDAETVTLKSFEEFVAGIEDFDSLYQQIKFFSTHPFTDADYLILNKPFYELSDALKIYFIDKSRYFSGSFTNKEYRMIYNMKGDGFFEGYRGMKSLYENKASGVCHDFACYTVHLFEQLDMEAFSVSKHSINHAFSVVKVKNSDGKLLWIPFDYGIGPAEHLMISENLINTYLKTEEMRYQFYLEGIKGAPDYKNFTDWDFK